MGRVRPKAKALMMKEFDEFVRNPSLPHSRTNGIDSPQIKRDFCDLSSQDEYIVNGLLPLPTPNIYILTAPLQPPASPKQRPMASKRAS